MNETISEVESSTKESPSVMDNFLNDSKTSMNSIWNEVTHMKLQISKFRGFHLDSTIDKKAAEEPISYEQKLMSLNDSLKSLLGELKGINEHIVQII